MDSEVFNTKTFCREFLIVVYLYKIYMLKYDMFLHCCLLDVCPCPMYSRSCLRWDDREPAAACATEQRL